MTSFVLSLVLYLREAGMRTALGAWFAGWSTGRLTLAAAAALAVAILAIGIGRHMLAEDHSTPHNEETNQRV
ncbi:hypothetical protein [Paraburkholderia sp. J8-2]|uniref:hypothetical protein n=1 Tax=Paraburkholderia sp. J8-2 TaxID=2805440 RepID=UPI002AB7E93B|nr:hypothetical protein [Paraburkholderia sp. J8-2]